MKYLIVGIGNIGSEYQDTRHNIGFNVLDALAGASNISFKADRYGAVAEMKHAGRSYILLKPSTYVNLSGKALNYWMKSEKIPMDRVLVVVDDLALPFGKLRLKPSGSAAGHNGLKNIEECLGSNKYARLRFGIGNDYRKGEQIKFVLGKWTKDEMPVIDENIDKCIDIIKDFGTLGVERTMNKHNKK